MQHILVWLLLDQGLRWELILDDLTKRPYIMLGAGALLLLLPLALTSTRGWMRRLGHNWERLHRLVYPAALPAVAHYLWLVKADYREPLVYAGALAVLLAMRVRGFQDKCTELLNNALPMETVAFVYPFLSGAAVASQATGENEFGGVQSACAFREALLPRRTLNSALLRRRTRTGPDFWTAFPRSLLKMVRAPSRISTRTESVGGFQRPPRLGLLDVSLRPPKLHLQPSTVRQR